MPQPENESRIRQRSHFLDGWCEQNPQRLQALADNGRLHDADAECVAEPPKPEPGGAFDAALRAFRNETLAIIAWRDLAGVDTLEATLSALSLLADRCIEAALVAAEQSVQQRHGVLRDAHGELQRLIIIGMGKLGGGELNFSSDIDLIFAYRGPGESDGDKPLDAEGYTKRVARRLVQILNESTRDGFVYRVDTRLRPFGDAGALTASITAMENYYQAHGREWERYAWVKARPVAGDLAGGQSLIRALRPFVYRRYLDYGTFESIREMKALIDRQVVKAELQDNIKLGSGGIREIEFIVQAFQLIRGGQEPSLQDARLLPTLRRLARDGHLPAHTAQELETAYRFLRRAENRLQMVDDRQTHELPQDEDERAALAESMAYDSWGAFSQAMQATREGVHQAFEQVFVSPQADDTTADKETQRLSAFWDGDLDEAQARALLAEYGIENVAAVREALTDIQGQSLYRGLEDRGRRWIARLIPLLFGAAARADNPDLAITRTIGVLAAIVGRSTYMALLVEHPAALSTLMRLCAASEWITSRIRAQPSLLDSLLDPRQLYRPPRRAELAANLAADMDAIDADDLELRMDTLRRFKQSATLRIAAADVSNSMPLMIVSDHLTELAELVLDVALDMAWHQMTRRYGTPRDDDGERAPFAIIAYGKLGGLELGYTSDLDLVFVYDGATEAMTDGDRQLTHQAFFTRLAQRLIHVLSTQTAAGRVYEIDMRLRPSGKAGMMVTHIDAFERYQQEHAWTWEHQALVRARPVSGHAGLGARFDEIRRAVLAKRRDRRALAREVCDMRDRMRGVKDESQGEWLDVKQMSGGLIDIEFIAQFIALAYGADCPELLIFTDAIRVLETYESAGRADYEDIRTLTSAYRRYRRIVHAQSLQRQRAMTGQGQHAEQRRAVAAIWQAWLGDVQPDDGQAR
ncbi:bifunctional [glutamate--ammonia ligase]-adenylyl-L-tyrosine phosphorylase/[glutamate--ammonia-ligase] adenylyltransferase [uncultured Salinisphaera sp.]|uniref:bifunctional [glutamate--ammonia ligase]-adenylyl-L-tyrosine phosphorylase/[glutamate--ammonia-ligase] adenylyltransferase n=1 Tax=uncultured Salinisphaera sp. TaxID=359372 RepID=UPI0032B17934